MALRMASTSTPTSAKTAIHMLASPVGAQHQYQRLDRQGEDNILPDDLHGAAGKPNGQRQLAGGIVHQDDISGLNGGIAAQGAHGDTDIGAGQNRSIIDAIADEHQRRTSLQQLLHRGHLIGGQQLGPVFIQTKLPSHGLGYGGLIAGQHHGLFHALGLEGPNGLGGIGLGGIGDDQIAEIIIIGRHVDNGADLGDLPAGNADLLH